MQYFFHKLNLRNKLILLALFPLIVFSVIVALRTEQLINDYQGAENNRLTIKIATQITQLVFELQKERGLSLGYANNQTPLTKSHLLTQRSATDKQLEKLLNSPLRQKLTAQLSEHTLRNTELASLFTSLDKYPNRIKSLRSLTPLETEKIYPVQKTLALYSSSNNELLELIGLLRLNAHDAYQSTAFSDLINLLRLQELAGQERGWLSHMLSLPELSNQDYQRLKGITTRQAHSLIYAKDTPIIQHTRLLDNMTSSIAHEKVALVREKLAKQMGIISLSKEVLAYLGNDRLFGHLYPYISPVKTTQELEFTFHLNLIHNELEQFEKSEYLTLEQRNNIRSLERNIDNFLHIIDDVKREASLSTSARNRLERIQIEIDAKAALLKEPEFPITQAAWWQLASKRIEQLHNISNSILDEMDQISLSVQDQAKTLLGWYLAIGLFSLCFFGFFTYKLINSLTQKIGAIALDMQLMAKNPNLNLKVAIKGHDELAQMAHALNHMISERTKNQDQQALASAVFEYSSEAILVANAQNEIELVNPAFNRITGYSQEEVLGKNPSILASKKHSREFYQELWQQLDTVGHWEGEIWNKRKDGHIYPEYLAITRVLDNHGQIKQYIGLFMDISNRKQYEKDIWYQTNFDSLTSLPNRNLAKERLAHELRQAEQANSELAMLLVDLDNFKYINDIHGHSTGDHMLVLVANRLSKLIGNDGFIARIDGDAFMIILPHIISTFEVEQIAINILSELETPFDYLDESLNTSASIGIAFSPIDGDCEDTLVRNAETAMFQAKEAGRNTFKCFTDEMDRSMRERFELEQRLRKAVINSEFCLHYQPIVSLETGKTTGVEALIRWQDPEHGLIPPDTFIPLAEETGLILPIGNWIVDQAVHDLACWQAEGLNMCVSINLSGHQCTGKNGKHFVRHLKQTIKQYHVNATSLRIEITETMLMQDRDECLATLEAIRALGASIYIDDFGTGYSSLSYLKQFPISVIKIDRSFVDSSLESESDANLIKAIIMMGKSLNMRLVAEGVETQAQWNYLAQLGCNYAQGYFIAKPMPYKNLITWINSNSNRAPSKIRALK